MNWKRVIPRTVKNQVYEILFSPVTTARCVFWVAACAVVLLTFRSGLYEPSFRMDFYKNLLVEAHGMLFDIIVIGVLILWLHKRGERQTANQRYEEEIDDFRNWKSDEAAHRIRGNIKRLNKNGISRINLSFCYLKNMDLKNTNLHGATLRHTDLSSARLIESDLQEAIFSSANLQGTLLMDANFRKAKLFRANMKQASLIGADFTNAQLGYSWLLGADFEEANLSEADLFCANLRGALNLTVEQLSKAKTLYKAKLDPELVSQIEQDHPHLLEKQSINE